MGPGISHVFAHRLCHRVANGESQFPFPIMKEENWIVFKKNDFIKSKFKIFTSEWAGEIVAFLGY